MPVTIKGTVRRRTDRAVLFRLSVEEDPTGFESSEAAREEWLPLSQFIGAGPESTDDGEEQTVTISDWIARQKNIRSNIGTVAPVEHDLERYDLGPTVTVNNVTRYTVVDRHNGPAMCECLDQRHARMIAAALNLTQDKV